MNWGRVFKFLFATAFLLAAAAVVIFVPVMTPVLSILVSGFISAGVAGLYGAWQDLDWRPFWKEVGIGALIGIVSGVFSFGASAASALFGPALGLSPSVANVTFRGLAGAITGAISNVIINLVRGKPWHKNLVRAVFSTALAAIVPACLEDPTIGPKIQQFVSNCLGEIIPRQIADFAIIVLSDFGQIFANLASNIVGQVAFAGKIDPALLACSIAGGLAMTGARYLRNMYQQQQPIVVTEWLKTENTQTRQEQGIHTDHLLSVIRDNQWTEDFTRPSDGPSTSLSGPNASSSAVSTEDTPSTELPRLGDDSSILPNPQTGPTDGFESFTEPSDGPSTDLSGPNASLSAVSTDDTPSTELPRRGDDSSILPNPQTGPTDGFESFTGPSDGPSTSLSGPNASSRALKPQLQIDSKRVEQTRHFKDTLEIIQYKAQRRREAMNESQLEHMPAPKTFETVTSRTAGDPDRVRVGAIGRQPGSSVFQATAKVFVGSKNKIEKENDPQNKKHKAASEHQEESCGKILYEHSRESSFKSKLCRVVPLILWDEAEQKYKMGDPAEWKLPNGLKVIAVSGAMSSGTTTFIHDQIIGFGYQLTENQILATMFKVGVIMYVLDEEQIVYLDICDNIDNISGALDGNNRLEENFKEKLEESFCPAGNFLLDLFGFAASTHFILHHSVDPTLSDYDSQNLTKQFIYSKLKFLAYNVHQFLQRAGPVQLSVVLRAAKSKLALRYADSWNHTILFNSNVENPELKQEDVGEDEKLMKLFSVRKFYALKYLPLQGGISMKTDEKLLNQRKAIMKAIEESKVHLASYPNEYLPDISIHWPQIWRELSENEELQAMLAKCTNERILEKKPEGQVEQRIATFYEQVSDLQKFVAAKYQNHDLLSRLQEAQDWCHSKTKEFQETAEDKRDPTIPFRCILKFSETILRTGIRISNAREVELKKRCVEISLRGYTLLIWSSKEPMFEFFMIRLAINEFSALNLLTEEVVCTMFDGAWIFFARAAEFGYKLSLVRHGVVDRAISCLASNSFFPNTHSMRFYILLTLRNMVKQEVQFPLSTYVDNFAKNCHLPDDEMKFEEFLCNLSFDAKELAETLTDNAFKRDGEIISEDAFIMKYKELVQRKLQSSSDQQQVQATANEAKDEASKKWQRVNKAFFRRLFLEIGTQTARKILQIGDSQERLRIFKQKLCRNDPNPNCLQEQAHLIGSILQIEETKFSTEILNADEFRNFTIHQLHNFIDLPTYRAALQLAAQAMYEEGRMSKEGSGQQQQQQQQTVHDMNTMRRQEQRLLEKQQFGELQLLLLRRECLEPILNVLLKQAILDTDVQTTVFSYVLTELLLSSEEDEYKNLSLSMFAPRISGLRTHATAQLSRCIQSEVVGTEPFEGCYRSAAAALMLYNKLTVVFFRSCDSDGDLSLEFLRLFYNSKLQVEDKTVYMKAAIGSEVTLAAVKLALKNFVNDDGIDLKFQTLIFLWNLQETSGMSLIDAKRKYLSQNIGSLADIRAVKLYWHRSQVANERHGFSEEQIARLLLLLESSGDTEKVSSLLDLKLAFNWGEAHAKKTSELLEKRQQLWKEAKQQYERSKARNARLRHFELKD